MEGKKLDLSKAITVVVSGVKKQTDDKGKDLILYTVEVQVGSTIWALNKRYSSFLGLHQALIARYPKEAPKEFPPRLVVHSELDYEDRRKKFQDYLQYVVTRPLLVDTWDLQFFLELKPNLGLGKHRKVLIPLPDEDFDPTEVAVPWKLFKMEGYEVTFATEKGAKPKGDEVLLKPGGPVLPQLGADWEAKQWYYEMEKDEKFSNPIKWEDIAVHHYDALLLPGGHAPGMKQYLDSDALQRKTAEFWALNRPVAAICHGVLVVARSKDSSGESILRNKKTTTLPHYMENAAYYITKWKYGTRWRTYTEYTEHEVRKVLSDSVSQFQPGPMTLFGTKGTAFDDASAFVVEDGNYISARWPGDAYLLAQHVIAKLNNTPSTTDGKTEEEISIV